MNRFAIIRGRTPVNFPDLYVIQDRASGVDYLAVETPHGDIAVVRLDQPEHVMGVVNTNYFP